MNKKYWVAVKWDWCVQYIARNLGNTRKCFIAEIRWDYSKATILGSGHNIDCLGHPLSDQPHSLEEGISTSCQMHRLYSQFRTINPLCVCKHAEHLPSYSAVYTFSAQNYSPSSHSKLHNYQRRYHSELYHSRSIDSHRNDRGTMDVL